MLRGGIAYSTLLQASQLHLNGRKATHRSVLFHCYYWTKLWVNVKISSLKSYERYCLHLECFYTTTQLEVSIGEIKKSLNLAETDGLCSHTRYREIPPSLCFAFRRANGSMSRKDNRRELREWVQSSLNCMEIFPQNPIKSNRSNIIRITSPHMNKSHACSFSNQDKTLGQLPPLRTQESVIIRWPTHSLTRLHSVSATLPKSSRVFLLHLAIWD